MGAVAVRAGRPAAAVLGPVLVRQGARVRRDTPMLPEAVGDRRGRQGVGPPLAVVVLGESTAAGVGVQTQDEGLAKRFAVELSARAGRSVHWRLVARTGATASHALRELVPQAVQEEYDLAVVVLGVNDTLRLRPLRAWRRDITGIVGGMSAGLRPGGCILFAGVPALGSFPALPQPLRAVMGLHARALDRGLSRLAARSSSVLHSPVPPLDGGRLLAHDHLHPNGEAYERWAALLADTALPWAATHGH